MFWRNLLFSLLRIGVLAATLSLVETNAQKLMIMLVALVWSITGLIEGHFQGDNRTVRPYSPGQITMWRTSGGNDRPHTEW